MKSRLLLLTRIGFTLQVIKTALAAAIAWWLASLISKNPYPYFAPLAAILTLQMTVADSLVKAMQRIIGVIGGVAVSMLAIHWLGLNAFSIGMVVLLGMSLSTALRLNPQIVSQIAVSSLLVLAFGRTPGYALDRIIETVLGSAVSVLISAILVSPDTTPAAQQEIVRINSELADILRSIGKSDIANQTPSRYLPHLERARSIFKAIETARQSIRLAEQNLRYNLFARKKRLRLHELVESLVQLERIAVAVRVMARNLADLSQDKSRIRIIQSTLAAIDSVANCLQLHGEQLQMVSVRNKAFEVAHMEARTRLSLCFSLLKYEDSVVSLSHFGSLFTHLNRILDDISGE